MSNSVVPESKVVKAVHGWNVLMEQEIRQALKTARQNGDRPIRSNRKSKREDLSGLFNSTIIHRREMSSMIPHFLNRDLARSVIVLLLNSSVHDVSKG